MKITEYPSASKLSATDVLLVDGTSGTRKVAVSDFPFALFDSIPEMHRMVYRGKNLGTIVTADQKAAIQNGTFTNLWLGDYWVIDGVNWRIVDFNYWKGFGDTKLEKPHLVIMPDTSLGEAAMNDTSVTTGGYIGSKMYTTNMASAKAAVTGAFSTLVLSHREYLINTVTSGYPSAGVYTDSTVDLPNEPMLYGSYIYTPAGNGTTDVKRYTISNRQLALFAICPEFILASNGFWLRDVASATHFARVDSSGGATSTGAASSYGIRPVFAIG